MNGTRYVRSYFLTVASISMAAFVIFYLFRQDHKSLSNDHLAQVYNGMSFEDIRRMPKYDRPDLSVIHDHEMTQDPIAKEVPVARSLRAFEELKKSFTNKKSGRSMDAIAGVSWQERGPNNVGGRTRALMFDPNDATGSKVWAAGVAGGLWFNNDISSGSSTWQNVDDFWANLAISCIAYDPSATQTFYVGTGEGFFNADAVRGAGIWKSTDGGTTWSQLSSTTTADFHYVQKIGITSTGIIIAATREGLFRSSNGGASWSQLFSGRFADVEVASNDDIYASEGIFTTGILRKSTNGGSSWSTVTPATGGERIEIAISPSNPGTVYAVASSGSNIAWMRKSTNGGGSWTSITVPPYVEQSCSNSATNDFSRGQAWYDLILTVHPTNPNIALVGGIDIYRTSNGGSSWNLVSYWTGACDTYVHADQHAMQFSPVNANVAIFGNDGGVYYSSNVGSSSNPSFLARNNGYNVTQFYAADQTNSSGSNYMLAGAQDNGSQQYTTSGINSTNEVTGGDGAFCHIDQLNSNYQVTSYVYNSFYRSTNGGASFSTILSNQTYGRFINPTDYDDDAKILYSAANEDQYIRLNDMTGTVSASLNSVSIGGYRVSAIKVSPYTNNRIFLGTGTNSGTGGSRLYRVDNANGSSPIVTQISTSSLPGNAYISSIDIGSSDDQVIITYSNYGVTSVWETRNGGTSWSNREGNLPDIPVRWVLYNPGNTDEVLLATELGVWSTDNVNTGSPIWGATSTGLANVRCDMLQYRDSDGQVLVATHGRGVYTGNPFSASTGGDTQPPTAPTNLSASGISASGFSISWDASSDNIGVTGYNVYVDGVLDGTTSLVSYSISGLSASTAYDVEVEATDAAGNLSTRVNVNVVTSSLGLTCFATASAFPYSESFESGVGSWQQGAGDDGDWVNYSGSTPSSNTGPSSASDGSFYMYLEASTNGTAGQIGANATAILDGPCFELSAETAATFSFSYHAYGSNVGSLSLEASTDGTSYTSLFDVAGNQGNSWQSVNVDLSSYLGSAVKLRLVGATGNGWSSDIAIDDLRLSTSGSGGSTISCTNTVTSFPYNQGFESGVGSWVQVSGDDGDWVNFIGSTPSSSTGPSGAFEGSLYMYLEASTNGTAGQIGNNATAILESPCLDLTSLSSGFFNFRYHMLGSNMGSLSLEASTDGSTWTSLWSQSGNQGNSWLSASISLSAYIGNVIKIRIVGVTGPGWQSDLAIDAIAVSTSAATPALETVSNPGVSKTPVEFGVEIFPNPVRDHLNIHIRGYDHVDYTLMAISGKMLRSGTLLQSERLDISELKTGYYLLHMQTLETNESIKFLKQ